MSPSPEVGAGADEDTDEATVTDTEIEIEDPGRNIGSDSRSSSAPRASDEASRAGAFSVNGAGPFAQLDSQTRFQKLTAQSPSGALASQIYFAVRMRGALDFEALKQACARVADRHEIFRARFDLVAAQFQIIPMAAAPRLPLSLFDFSDVDSFEVELDKWLRANAERAIDVTTEAPIRLHLLKKSASEHVLSLVAHHIALDGWSLAVFLSELGACYSAELTGQELQIPSSLQISSYTQKFSRWLDSEAAREHEEYWRGQWPKSPPSLVWSPVALAASSSDFRGARIELDLGGDTLFAVKTYASKRKASLLMVLMAAFQSVLHAKTGAREIGVGIPVAARDVEGADRMLGNCVNLLPLKTRVEGAGATLEPLLDQVKKTLLQGYAHMAYPYEKVKAYCGGPLFQVSFNKEPTFDFPKFAGLTGEIVPFPVVASEFDLTVNVTELKTGLHIEADFREAVLGKRQVEAWLAEYASVLKSLA